MATRQAAPRAELDILITRVFDAPRELVWKAWTQPGHVERWFGPRGFDTEAPELDLRVGGRSRYVMVGPDGKRYPCAGVFREIVPLERIVTTDEFGEDFQVPDMSKLPSGIVLTCLFEDAGDDPPRTRVTLRIAHPTLEDRRKNEAMGVVDGWNSSFQCLDGYLAELLAGGLDERRIVISRWLDAPRELVWRAWTERDRLMQWYCPSGFTVLFVENDLRVGGAWRSAMRGPDGSEYIHHGEYRRIDRPSRLVFTHSWEKNDLEPPADTVATVTLTEKDGRTRMVFEQVGFATFQSGESHRGGWSGAFENLADCLAAAAG